ncbi:MAG TPA: cystathionine beta-lyase [Sphingomicrobium sp.]|jgi:cystathionine beta-lyase
MMDEEKLGIPTQLVKGGRRKEWRGRLVNAPVERASTILFDDIAELRSSKAGLGSYRYGLQGTATHWALAEAMTDLEPGAAGTALYQSGLASITGPLLALLSAGDELLVPDNVYGPTRKFCDTILKRFGIGTRYYDPLIGTAIEGIIAPNTRAIHLESPGSLTMEVQDVPGICEVARARGIVTLLDNTWATPLLFPAIAAGVDVSVLAATKYVGGHADLLLGTATATDRYYDRIQTASWDLGYAVSPDDAWLASRGLRTMGIRLAQHEKNCLKVAEWLKGRSEVGLMLHPAFEDCPGHSFWKRDFKGSSGLFTFELQNRAAEKRTAFIEALQLFGIGYSWGGFESLALPVDPHRTVSQSPAANLVRLHIGLEDPDDLIADLAQAFDQAGRSP